jgi:hypothetical protein
MGRVDHDDLCIAPLGGQFGKNARKNAKTAPPNPAVIKRLVRAIFGGASRQRNPLRFMKIIPLRPICRPPWERRGKVERTVLDAPTVRRSARINHSCSTPLLR